MLSAAWGPRDWGLDGLHLTGAFGGRVPFNRNKESTSFMSYLQLDYVMHKYFVPMISLNGMHWTDSGDGTFKVHGTRLSPKPTLSQAQAALGTGSFEGVDVVNLGSRGVAGNDLVTMAFGARIPVTDHVSLGAIYELPVTHGEDLINQRVSMSVLLEY